MSTMFFERSRTRRMSAPPAVLPERAPRPEFTTELYRRTVYTPSVEYVELPGVSTRDTAINWSGRSAGVMQMQPLGDGSNNVHSVLILDGVSR